MAHIRRINSMQMHPRRGWLICLVLLAIAAVAWAQVTRAQAPRQPGNKAPQASPSNPVRQPASGAPQPAVLPQGQPQGQRAADAVADAQRPRGVEATRPEQQLKDHDRPERFSAKNATPSSPVFKSQAKEGRITGFDFYRDPLNADHPMMTLQEIFQNESAARPQVNAAQRKLLESRYDLTPHPDQNVTMSRGKPIQVGPTAKLPQGVRWETLAEMQPAEIRRQGAFPYPSLPHPLQVNGGQLFPKMQIDMFPRLQRFDVEF